MAPRFLLVSLMLRERGEEDNGCYYNKSGVRKKNAAALY
jgi:hypothetical protein